MQHSPAILEKYRARVEEYLYMVSSVKNTEIANAIKYHFGWLDQEGNATSSMQGKGIRSSLCMFACESVGGVLDNALQGAAAVELVHNFSLVHDDIQDQDEERRHRPTVWSIWGVSKALQVGNYIRILSDLTVKNSLNQILDNNLRLRCTETLSEAYLETVEGQYLDLEYEGKLDITTKEYLEMISRKTGALISCALLLKNNDLIIAERRYPDRVGQTYQIKHNKNHQWFYFPKMTCDEAIIFRVYESEVDGRARFTPHTSFIDPHSADTANERESIEVRIMAFF